MRQSISIKIDIDDFIVIFKLQIENNNWRRERDSNPRSLCRLNGFQDRRIQPLCHLSEEFAS